MAAGIAEAAFQAARAWRSREDSFYFDGHQEHRLAPDLVQVQGRLVSLERLAETP